VNEQLDLFIKPHWPLVTKKDLTFLFTAPSANQTFDVYIWDSGHIQFYEGSKGKFPSERISYWSGNIHDLRASLKIQLRNHVDLDSLPNIPKVVNEETWN